jgi:nitrite transporter
MPLPLHQALDDQAALAADKASLARTSITRYVASSLLAGAFFGVAVVVMLMVTAPMLAVGSGNVRLVQGAVFGVGLVLVAFAGAELFNENTSVMLQGLWSRTTSLVDLAIVWGASLVGNVLGALGFVALVDASGVVTATGTASAGQQTVFSAALAGISQTKASLTGGQLFFRAVLCGFLVCLAMWMAARATSDGAKLLCLWWGLLAFVVSGFEHAVTNVALLALAALSGSGEWGEVTRSLLYTVPGNVVGGSLLVGAAYAWLAGPGGDVTSGPGWRSLLQSAEVAGPASPPLASQPATEATEQLPPASSTSAARRRRSTPPPSALVAEPATAATRENGN